jgi:hypothetical protein
MVAIRHLLYDSCIMVKNGASDVDAPFCLILQEKRNNQLAISFWNCSIHVALLLFI